MSWDSPGKIWKEVTSWRITGSEWRVDVFLGGLGVSMMVQEENSVEESIPWKDTQQIPSSTLECTDSRLTTRPIRNLDSPKGNMENFS